MNTIILNLVVLRFADIARAEVFYSRLGLHFTKHRHGKGAEHFAAEISGGVFELYSQTADSPSTLGTRIGFAVPSVDKIIVELNEYPNAIISAPKDSEWGRRAVIADPEGHRIELVEAKT
jgi:lactoylglutathione lyase